MNSLQTVMTIFRKEIVDALRDRRTLLTVLISSVLMGPLVLLAISGLVASLESNAEQREVVVEGLDDAPSLKNYFERQTYTVRAAPAGFEALLRSAKLTDAVVVVPKDFEAALQRGDAPLVEIVSDSANQRSQASAGRAARLLGGFGRERALLSLKKILAAAIPQIPAEANWPAHSALTSALVTERGLWPAATTQKLAAILGRFVG